MRKQKNKPNILKYTSIGIEMTLIIGGFGWAGFFLDNYIKNNKPWFLIFLSLLGVFIATYTTIKKLQD